MEKKNMYYAGFGLYMISFFLPTLKLYGGMSGWMCAVAAVDYLVGSKGVFDFAVAIFINLSNALTILNFIIQFRIGLKKIFVSQLIAVISGCYWIVAAFYASNYNFEDLLIGFWLWLFSLVLMAFSMCLSLFRFRGTLKTQKMIHSDRPK
jgi:hypothetical protein